MIINQTLLIIAEGSTNTTLPIITKTSISIYIQNSAPIINYAPDIIKVKISEGLHLSVANLNYWSSNSSSIAFSDDEEDTIYLSIDSDISGYAHSQSLLDRQDWEFSLYINTSNFSQENHTMKLNIWDIFHKDKPSEKVINIQISYFVPPVFEVGLPSSLIVQICQQTLFNLPNIYDMDGDFSKIAITQQK